MEVAESPLDVPPAAAAASIAGVRRFMENCLRQLIDGPDRNTTELIFIPMFTLARLPGLIYHA
jgi:hypothetical protein